MRPSSSLARRSVLAVTRAYARNRRLRTAAHVSVAVAVVAASIVSVGVQQASAATASLEPAAGQYFPVAASTVLDTINGTGGYSTQLASGATDTVQVAGVGAIPASGVSDVYMAVDATAPSASGCLNDYDTDLGDPTSAGICDVSFDAGNSASLTDITQVSASGYVSFTNESGGTVGVTATVFGYYQDNTGTTAGETYVPVAQQNVGSQTQSIAAGGQITVQVAGQADIPSAATGAGLSIGAKNGTAAGFISAWPTGGSSNSAPLVTYQASGATAHGVYQGNLSASGQLTLLNTGSAAVTVTLGSEGYFLSAAATPAGSAYLDVPQAVAANTSDGTGGVAEEAIPANSSITYPVEGVDGIPASGVTAVVEDVRAYQPQDNGFLTVYAAGGSDPGQPGVNFAGGGDQGNNLTIPMVSSAGQQTITNHSSGTVQVIVALRGYYNAPVTPTGPEIVSAAVSGSSATVTWNNPPMDGGSPITSYTVSTSPDSDSVTVDGATQTATLTGLANAGTDTYSVTATNAVGTSSATTYNPSAVTEQDLQDIGVVTDTTSNTETLDTSSSLTGTQTDGADGSESVSGTPDTSDVFNTADSDTSDGNCSDSLKGAKVTALPSWNNNHTETSYSEHWTIYPYAASNAKHYGASGGNPAYYVYEEAVCTVGGGDTWNNWVEGFVGVAIVMAGAFAKEIPEGNALYHRSWGSHNGKTERVTSSTSFGFNSSEAGASASVNGTFTTSQEIADSVYSGDVGVDGLWGTKNFPSSLGKYPDTRVNTYWLATNSNGYTDLWEGNTGGVVYQTVQGNKIYVHAVAGISGFCTDQDPIGNCYGPGFGPQPG